MAGLAAGTIVPAAGCGGPGDTSPVRVAAAADLARAFPDVAAAFTARTGQAVALSFGSSGILAHQLVEGAPFDAFAAADVAFVDRAVAAGACRADSAVLYARGQLALWWRAGLDVAPPRRFADVADARFRRVAIANPDHAPYAAPRARRCGQREPGRRWSPASSTPRTSSRCCSRWLGQRGGRDRRASAGGKHPGQVDRDRRIAARAAAAGHGRLRQRALAGRRHRVRPLRRFAGRSGHSRAQRVRTGCRRQGANAGEVTCRWR